MIILTLVFTFEQDRKNSADLSMIFRINGFITVSIGSEKIKWSLQGKVISEKWELVWGDT